MRAIHRKLFRDLWRVRNAKPLWSKLGTTFGYPPSNGTAKLPPEFEHMRVPQSAFERAARLDYGIMTANSAKNLERWNKEVLG